ncbi:MAG TPA: hypothetical protein VJZ00_20005 [Thermoanaerobaculia bacterium]|nr:hypothetical protein [Thermoanaerobaculia bacterium]
MTRRRIAELALFFAAALVAVATLRNYDFFWHLATGRWIVEHRALPPTDPFAIASDRVPWINGEWLFEVVLHALHAMVGLAGMSVLRGLLAAAVFALAKRDDGLALCAIAFAGAMATFDMRPSSVALLFLVIALRVESPLAHAINTILWINIHPSAILAPVVAALRTRRVAPALASALALLVNPFGIRGVLAPIELTLFARSGAFVNAEWLPSPVRLFPLLYICIAIAIVIAIRNKPEWWRLALLALFAYLAVRHVRNQGLFFAAFPILLAPVRLPRIATYAITALALLFVLFTTDHRLGISPQRFPVNAVARLQATQLRGNVYNADQFGGYLIHAFYPERRTLTDGRNELYHAYIPEYAHARRDERAWRALLAKYRIDLAVEEYLPPVPVTDAVTRKTQPMAASLAYWPREEWALIGFDRAAMVFARRAAFPREAIAKWEIRGVVPDAPPRR